MYHEIQAGDAVQHHNVDLPQSSQYYLKHAMLKYNVNMLRIHPLMFEAEISFRIR